MSEVSDDLVDGFAPLVPVRHYQLMRRVKHQYRVVIMNVINDPDPVEHIRFFLKTLPEHVLKMDPTCS